MHMLWRKHSLLLENIKINNTTGKISLGKGATSEAGKYLFRAANVWWRCAQYFVIATCD